MKSSSSARERLTLVLSVMIIASLLSGLLLSRGSAAPPEVPASTEHSTEASSSPYPDWAAIAKTAPSPAVDRAIRKAWRGAMSRTSTPKKGCFEALYPSSDWQEVPCTTAPPRPNVPARGPRPTIVGNGNDSAAQTPGPIASATGSFDSVTGVTSENETGNPDNSFSLQLNTNNDFTTSLCKDAVNPSECTGWQQFLYYNNAGKLFIQYWLMNYGPTCPTERTWYPYGGNCYTNSTNVTHIPSQTIANLENLSLMAQANSGGSDVAILSTGNEVYLVTGDNVFSGDLAQGWNKAEFNILGECCCRCRSKSVVIC